MELDFMNERASQQRCPELVKLGELKWPCNIQHMNEYYKAELRLL